MKKVLIAEDNESNYLLTSTILRGKYELCRAMNGQEAVDKVISEKPDIVLMDWKMPLMDGLEATQKIRTFNTELPIIALTAYAFDADRRKALEAGCNEFVTKPVKIKELLNTLEKY
ncbi:MAG: response regulator [Bacteroidales bacterium]